MCSEKNDVNWRLVASGGVKVVSGAIGVVGGVIFAETGVAIAAIPIGITSYTWGAAEIAAGFGGSDIQYSGIIDIAIQENTKPGFTRDALQGINTLSGMLIGQGAVNTGASTVMSIIESGYSIYESSSKTYSALSGDTK